MCLPKHKGGLGIKDILTFNLALLGKWMWNLMQHQGSLWVAVLEAKYGGFGGGSGAEGFSISIGRRVI